MCPLVCSGGNSQVFSAEKVLRSVTRAGTGFENLTVTIVNLLVVTFAAMIGMASLNGLISYRSCRKSVFCIL